MTGIIGGSQREELIGGGGVAILATRLTRMSSARLGKCANRREQTQPAARAQPRGEASRIPLLFPCRRPAKRPQTDV